MSARDIIEQKLALWGHYDGASMAEALLKLLTKSGYRIIGPDALDPVTVERCAAHLTDVAAAMWERTETHRGDEPFSNPTNAGREDATTAYCLDKAAEAIRALCKEEAGK